MQGKNRPVCAAIPPCITQHLRMGGIQRVPAGLPAQRRPSCRRGSLMRPLRHVACSGLRCESCCPRTVCCLHTAICRRSLHTVFSSLRRMKCRTLRCAVCRRWPCSAFSSLRRTVCCLCCANRLHKKFPTARRPRAFRIYERRGKAEPFTKAAVLHVGGLHGAGGHAYTVADEIPQQTRAAVTQGCRARMYGRLVQRFAQQGDERGQPRHKALPPQCFSRQVRQL